MTNDGEKWKWKNEEKQMTLEILKQFLTSSDNYSFIFNTGIIFEPQITSCKKNSKTTFVILGTYLLAKKQRQWQIFDNKLVSVLVKKSGQEHK